VTPWKVTLKNGETRWKVRVRAWDAEKGKLVKRTLTFDTKGACEDELHRLREKERRRRHGIPEPLGDVNYDDLAARVLEQYPYSEASRKTLNHNLKHSRRHFGNSLVRELSAETIGAWHHRLELRPQTKRNVLKAMRQVLSQGVEWGYLATNPAANVKLPKLQSDSAHPFESWDEVNAVAAAIATAHEPYRALVIFASATGLREQEWRALRWQDVDVEKRIARVTQTIRDGKIEQAAKNEGSRRSIRLPRRALDALAELPTPINRGQLVFPDRRSNGPIDVDYLRRNEWADALEAAKLAPRGPGQMRHTFATLALADGVPIELVSKQLGHNSIRTTQEHYARFLPATDERMLMILDASQAGADAGGLKVDSTAAGEAAE
jgi:integrase